MKYTINSKMLFSEVRIPALKDGVFHEDKAIGRSNNHHSLLYAMGAILGLRRNYIHDRI